MRVDPRTARFFHLFMGISMNQRQGTSLLDVLLSLAVIGVLIAIALPAVNGARGALRRTQCRNRLRQVGMASLARHDIVRSLPSVDRSEDIRTGWGPCSELLPYIEHSSLANRINRSMSTLNEDNRSLLAISLPIFTCPASLRYTLNTQVGHERIRLSGSNYVFCAPVVDDLSKTRLRDITDGTSATFLCSETIPDTLAEVGVNWGGVPTTSRRYHLVSEPIVPVIREAKPGAAGSLFGTFNSHHEVGSNFGFCDGAVTFVSNAIDDQVFEALGTPNGKEVSSR